MRHQNCWQDSGPVCGAPGKSAPEAGWAAFEEWALRLSGAWSKGRFDEDRRVAVSRARATRGPEVTTQREARCDPFGGGSKKAAGKCEIRDVLRK